jgi:hypothetical protein
MRRVESNGIRFTDALKKGVVSPGIVTLKLLLPFGPGE